MSQTTEAPVRSALEPYRPMVSGAPALPQVNLLPPAVRERRALQRLKLYLLCGVAGSVVVAGGLWYYSTSEPQLGGRGTRHRTDADVDVAP